MADNPRESFWDAVEHGFTELQTKQNADKDKAGMSVI